MYALQNAQKKKKNNWLFDVNEIENPESIVEKLKENSNIVQYIQESFSHNYNDLIKENTLKHKIAQEEKLVLLLNDFIENAKLDKTMLDRELSLIKHDENQEK